jgi:hypothetical protein
MIDRQKVETVLRRRFPDSDWKEIATAANAIVGLEDEWEELEWPELSRVSGELERGAEIRIFRRINDVRR